METIVISLPDSQRVYIEEQIRLGGYSNASEYFSLLIERERQAKERETMLPDIRPRLKEIIAQTRLGLEKIYGEELERVILFGSQARGDARADSDIDLLIVLKNPFDYSTESDRISFLIADLCLEYNVLISCAFATNEQFQHHNSGFFRNVRAEGIAV
jgi:predicted nucleotidyltransferase